MPHLHWIGKDKVINHHNDVRYRPLEAQYTFGNPDTAKENMIIHGDNLEALKSLLPLYEGRIDCIYIDPPYNTGNEGWVYNDNVNDPKIKKWLGEVVGKEGEDLSRHDKWLCMMYPRLRLLQRLQADNGIIFVSIGDDELSSLIQIMDDIWGKKNNAGIFCWKSRAKPANVGKAKYKPQKVAEYILSYTKHPDNFEFVPVYSGEPRTYPNTTPDGRKYRLTTILKSNRGESQRDTMRFEIAGYIPDNTQRWQGGFDLISSLYKTGYIEFREGTPFRRYYEDEEPDEHMPFYTYMPSGETGTAESGKNLLNSILGNTHGFDTVKPLELMIRLLKATTKDNSIILDSFSGSATTAHAVLELNKQSGNRKFIMVEMMDYAETITAERIRRVINGYGEGDKAVAGLGGGFTYYTLGIHLFDEKGNLIEPINLPKLREYIWWVETKSPMPKDSTGYYLGENQGVGYYAFIEEIDTKPLTYKSLAKIKQKHSAYVIYAESCSLSEQFLVENHITFKKLPEQISRV